MMKKLTTGNYVLNSQGDIVQVSSIKSKNTDRNKTTWKIETSDGEVNFLTQVFSSDVDNYRLDNRIGAFIKQNNSPIKPIKLDTGILEDLGFLYFEEESLFKIKDVSSFSLFVIYKYKHDERFVFGRIDKGVFAPLFTVKYLHQIQNVFHDLAKINLKLNNNQN